MLFLVNWCLLFSVGLADECSSTFLPTDGLMIVDVQNSFLPERIIPSNTNYNIPSNAKTQDGLSIAAGSLAVNGGDKIIPIINDWITAFHEKGAKIYASLDWHPADSCSFSSTGGAAFNLGVKKCTDSGNNDECPSSFITRCQDEESKLSWNANQYSQWPSHCVQKEFGARFDPSLNIPKEAIVIKKGIFTENDSYSAYGGFESIQSYPFDTEDDTIELSKRNTFTEILNKHGIERLWITGLATDYCVVQTVLDSLGGHDLRNPQAHTQLGPSSLKSVIILESAIRGVVPTTTTEALQLMKKNGAILMEETFTDPIETLKVFCPPQDTNSDTFPESSRRILVIVGVIMLVASFLGGWAYYYLRKREPDSIEMESHDLLMNADVDVGDYVPPE